MHLIYRLTCFAAIAIIIVNCGLQDLSPEKTAKTYCSTCHIFPEPVLLNRKAWLKEVLPKMCEKLGIVYVDGEYYTNPADSSGHSITGLPLPAISMNDWNAIVEYYTSSAPVNQPLQDRQPVALVTDRFTEKEAIVEGNYPSTTWIRIDPGNRLIYTGSAYDSSFSVFDTSLRLAQKQNIHKVIVDMDFDNDLHAKGARTGILTDIGILYPNDSKTGSLQTFQLSPGGKLHLGKLISDTMPRPVQTIAIDLDNDSLRDYLVCGFGNNTGALYYLKQKNKTQYEEKVLRQLPGAIKAYIDDYDKDGLPDIIVLFAQSEEGIFLFLNKGNGNFETKELLRFSPLNGSTYFELKDMDGDGLKDILYTCGDNLDYTADVLKSYHGVYVFLNKGNYRYKQHYFFPIHGCYKAVTRDFDKDGDPDIAAISYFPDARHQLQESFVYLENKGSFRFTPFAIRQYNSGNWISMDAADVDGDGDEDIVLGSMLLTIVPYHHVIAPGKKDKPSFLLLLNRTR